LKYNKSYIIFAACPGHYGYNFQEQFITSLPEEILNKRSFLILKKLRGDMKSNIARPLVLSKTTEIYAHVTKTAMNKIVSPIDNLGIK